ncbi:hypothetical protein PanWU01x14_180880 [Parasponia andersonii]|uniref:Uncharacterized protein n=1 Tax=Parasponia andersonii TaxID=3476 RepID=A0A2P5C615_PARAD|nr:hypothetical protein PanWU01x14_180880 [Parasponia andersonii]
MFSLTQKGIIKIIIICYKYHVLWKNKKRRKNIEREKGNNCPQKVTSTAPLLYAQKASGEKISNSMKEIQVIKQCNAGTRSQSSLDGYDPSSIDESTLTTLNCSGVVWNCCL